MPFKKLINAIELLAFARANSEYQQDQMLRRFTQSAALCGAQYACKHRVPAWECDKDSKLTARVQDIWEKLRGVRPPVAIFHAGVEPGLFVKKMQQSGKKLEAINIGVHNINVHSPKERVEIASLARTYELLATILRELD